jgi:hypothetical protein
LTVSHAPNAPADSACDMHVRWLILHANLGVAWMFNMAYSLALAFLATWTVVAIAPQAAGAGVAEVTAYLNGCNLPKVSRPMIVTMTANVASACAAYAHCTYA